MELRQNWNKFQRVVGLLPPKKPGLAVVHSHGKLIAGAASSSTDTVIRQGFDDQGLSFDHLDSAWEVLSSKYGAAGATFIEKEELQQALAQVAAVRGHGPVTENFYWQISRLRSLLKVDRGDRTKLAMHSGDKSSESYWPREHFLFNFFQSFFADLLPERKLLLLIIAKGQGNFESVLLEFQGAELKGFSDPDFTGLDGRNGDLFLRSTISRFVLWCENHYLLPTYALVLSSRLAEECREIQIKGAKKQAWKQLLRARNQRDVDPEVLVEPEPWPVKALLYWHSFRG